MKRLVELTLMLALGLSVFAAMAWASSVDKYIKELKDGNPDVRANAAYELGCG